jgi:hypothetical protein
VEPVDLTSGDVKTDTLADRYGLVTQRRLARSREKGNRLFDRVRVQQYPIARLQPLLRDEEPLRPISGRDEMLGGETARAGDDGDSGMIDATSGRGRGGLRVIWGDSGVLVVVVEWVAALRPIVH